MSKLLITKTTSLDSIRQTVSTLREQKGKEIETLKLIDESLRFGHDFVASLFFEKALSYQHIYMNNNMSDGSSDKKALSNMEKVILNAKDYINKNNLSGFNSKICMFLGKVADYKGQYKKAISCYKKSGNGFESMSHLSYSMIMDGQIDSGYKLAMKTYNSLLNSKDGKTLMKKDYITWAIWISGVTARTVKALIVKNASFDKQEVEKWVNDTEKFLNKDNLFSYRKAEIDNLWIKLQNYKKK